MMLTGIDPSEVSSALILQHWLLNHGIVRSLCLSRRSQRKWASLWVFLLPTLTKAVELLFDNFGQERPLDYTSVLKILTTTRVTVLVRTSIDIRETLSKANFIVIVLAIAETPLLIGAASRRRWNTPLIFETRSNISSISIHLSRLHLHILLHFLVLYTDKWKEIGH